MKTAISYVRWSSGRQSHGESLERQLSKTKEFCAANNLILDLELVEVAKSAFKGKHKQKGGKLAKFLEDLDKGLIPKGVVLIVESLDRLSRETVPIALRQFLQIIEHDIEIVTLIDGSWYSRKSLGNDSTPLLMSLVYMMRAHDESKHKAYRLGELWKGKRQRAIEHNTPMTSIVPGWLQFDKATKKVKMIPDRAKKVKLMFWLWIRGWSRQRIARLFNTHQVPTWGKKKRKTTGWHHSYIQKILTSRAVLGELVPHSTRDQEDQNALAGDRKPVAEAIKGYYPAIIPEAVFYRAMSRRSGPRGPIGEKVANLLQGLLKDGENPTMTMCYRDHGTSTKWQYVVSDLRRTNPKAPLFSWQYAELEQLILRYLADLDWSSLTASSSQEVSVLKNKLGTIEGKIKGLSSELNQLIELAKVAKGIAELGAKMEAISEERTELRRQAGEIRSTIKAKEGFLAQDGQRLIYELAGKPGFDSRQRLRLAIRQQIKRIDLFRDAPKELGIKGKCVKINFSNGAERWIFAERNARLDGKMPDQPEIVNDKMGRVIQDQRSNSKLMPVKFEQWKKGKK